MARDNWPPLPPPNMGQAQKMPEYAPPSPAASGVRLRDGTATMSSPGLSGWFRQRPLERRVNPG